jgi:hypothetical protein
MKDTGGKSSEASGAIINIPARKSPLNLIKMVRLLYFVSYIVTSDPFFSFLHKRLLESTRL